MNETSGQYLYLNPVAPGDNPPGRLSARVGERWFFNSGDRVLTIEAAELARLGASLDQARPVPLPPGRPRGLVACKDWLAIAVQPPGQQLTSLFSRGEDDPSWRKCLEFLGEPSQFCRGGRDGAVFFVANPDDKDQPEPRAIYCSTDGESWRVFDYIHATEAQHVHGISCLDDQLLILVGDQHFRHLLIRAFDQAGRLLDDPLDHHRRYLGLAEHSLYHIMPGPGGQPLLAVDGPTILLDKAGQMVFKDQTPRVCGFQVAAHGCFAARPDVLLFGSWRRNQQCPWPCLYVLTPRCLYKYVNQSRAFDDSLAWTGYQCNDATFYNLDGVGDHGFWPCYGGESVYFALVDRERAERLLDEQPGRLGIAASADRRQAQLTPPALLPL